MKAKENEVQKLLQKAKDKIKWKDFIEKGN